MNPYFFLFEFGAIFAFLAVLCRERKNRQMIEVLILAFVYGIILEALNIHMSKEIYVYSSAFFLEIMGVPLAIGAGWAVLFYLASGAVKKFNLAWWQSPFLMALIALSYDLAIDAVAIRLGFWSWKIPLDQEWFGVPYENFFGWLAVVWTFAFFINLSSRDFVKEKYRRTVRYLAPAVSALLLGAQIMVYISLSVILSGKFSWDEAVNLYAGQERAYAYLPEVGAAKGYLLLAIIFVLSFLLFRQMKKKGRIFEKPNMFALALSLTIHFMFLFFLLTSQIYQELPVLILISVLVLILNFILEMPPVVRRNAKV